MCIVEVGGIVLNQIENGTLIAEGLPKQVTRPVGIICNNNNISIGGIYYGQVGTGNLYVNGLSTNSLGNRLYGTIVYLTE